MRPYCTHGMVECYVQDGCPLPDPEDDVVGAVAEGFRLGDPGDWTLARDRDERLEGWARRAGSLWTPDRRLSERGDDAWQLGLS